MEFENSSSSSSGEIEKASGSWGVADGYTKLKILKPLVEMDSYLQVAIYGSEKIEDCMSLSIDVKTRLRIEAIRRLIDCIRETIANARFALKAVEKNKIDELESRTLAVLEVLPAVASMQIDMRNNQQTVVINEEHFLTCLEELRSIKTSLPEPLNRASLIFRASDEIDLDAIKRQIIEGG